MNGKITPFFLNMERETEVGTEAMGKDYHYVEEDGSIQSILERWREKPEVGVDTETTGLDYINDRVRLLQLAVQGEPVLVIDCYTLTRRGKSALSEFLRKPVLKIFHHAKFDLHFLESLGVASSPPYCDTMLAAQILDSGRRGKGFSLAETTQEWLGRDIDKGLQKSDWNGGLEEQQISYAAQDAAVLLPLWQRIRRELERNELVSTTRLEHLCLGALVAMERRGMPLDLDRWEKLSLEVERNKLSAEKVLRAAIGQVFPAHDEQDPARVNIDSHPQVLAVLRRMGLPLKGTSRRELYPLAGSYPIVAALLEYRRSAKQYQAFTRSLLRYIHPRTGRLHPQYKQIGTATGRLSCRNPNLQQIPRNPAFRSCFAVSGEWCLIIGDYSQIELRILAEITQDVRMIESFQKGGDLHQLTASLILNKNLEEVTREERNRAKAVNFGLIYAMGERSLQSYAQSAFGVEMSTSEAHIFHKRFFEAYPAVHRWQEKLRRQMPREIRTLGGRRRLWEGIPRFTELCNTPIQGTAADIIKEAMSLLPEALEGTQAWPVATVHDEIVLEARRGNAPEVAALLKNIMVKAGRRYIRTVPVEADITISTDWSKQETLYKGE